jgi:hypothetical protein
MQSISNVVKLLQRIARIDQPVRIFYLSDFDPGGETMPRAVARQLEFWQAQYAPRADIKLTPLVLTREQVERYQLDRIPIKASDQRREGFEGRHGEGACELDALEARHPGELARLVRAALDPYQDHAHAQRLAAAEQQAQRAAADAWEEALETAWQAARAAQGDSPTGASIASAESVTDELTAIAADAQPILACYTAELERLRDELAGALAPLQDRLTRAAAVVQEAADTFDPALPERPAPAVAPPDERGWLFASDRDYLAQLDAYQAYRDGPGDDEG